MSALSGKPHAIPLLFPPRFPAEKRGTSPVSEAENWAFLPNVACEKSWFCLYSVFKNFCHLFKDLSVCLSTYQSVIYLSLSYLSSFLLSIHLSIHSFILTLMPYLLCAQHFSEIFTNINSLKITNRNPDLWLLLKNRIRPHIPKK